MPMEDEVSKNPIFTLNSLVKSLRNVIKSKNEEQLLENGLQKLEEFFQDVVNCFSRETHELYVSITQDNADKLKTVHGPKMAQLSTDISNWAINLILNEEDDELRNLLYVALVNATYYAMEQRDFSTTMALKAALYNSSIIRLYKQDLTVKSKPLPLDTVGKLELIYAVTNDSKNFKSVREISQKSCLPFLGISLQDLEFAQENKGVDGTLTQHGHSMVEQIMHDFSDAIRGYALPSSKYKPQDFFDSKNISADAEVQYTRSLAIKPRDTRKISLFTKSFYIFDLLDKSKKAVFKVPLYVADVYLAEVLEGRKFSSLVRSDIKDIPYDEMEYFLKAMGKADLPSSDELQKMLITLGVDLNKISDQELRRIKLSVYIKNVSHITIKNWLEKHLDSIDISRSKKGKSRALLRQLDSAVEGQDYQKFKETIAALGFKDNPSHSMEVLEVLGQRESAEYKNLKKMLCFKLDILNALLNRESDYAEKNYATLNKELLMLASQAKAKIDAKELPSSIMDVVEALPMDRLLNGNLSFADLASYRNNFRLLRENLRKAEQKKAKIENIQVARKGRQDSNLLFTEEGNIFGDLFASEEEKQLAREIKKLISTANELRETEINFCQDIKKNIVTPDLVNSDNLKLISQAYHNIADHQAFMNLDMTALLTPLENLSGEAVISEANIKLMCTELRQYLDKTSIDFARIMVAYGDLIDNPHWMNQLDRSEVNGQRRNGSTAISVVQRLPRYVIFFPNYLSKQIVLRKYLTS